MDFFALPKVFHLQMMLYVPMKDRLRLRLTSRAFAKLVAETNAGYYNERCAMEEPMFDHKKLPCEDTVSVYIGGAKFHCVPKTEEGFSRILYLKNLLFSGIVLESFSFQLDESIPFEFVRKLVKNVKIRKIHLCVDSERQLGHALQLIADYNESAFTMGLFFRPEMAKLLSIPPMEKLKISLNDESAWSLDELFKLLGAQPNFTLVQPVEDITLPNLKKVLQVLSSDDRSRRVNFRARNETVRASLAAHRIDALTEEGFVFGEASIAIYFELVSVRELQGAVLHLRYRRCNVELKHIDWTGDRENVGVHISNCDEW